MVTSYTVLKDRIQIFCDNHYQIEKFGGEFQSEINNFATKDERYPILYLSPINQRVYENVTEFDLDIYVLDLIDDDRSNINVILSDTNLILNDLYNYYKEGYDSNIDVIGNPSLSPLNNQLLDYAAGWVMRITLEVNNYTACQIPFIDGIPYVSSDNCQTNTYKYLTCETVTGCTSLQEYIAEQIAAIPSGTSVTGFSYEASGNTLSIELSDNSTFDVIINEMSGMTFTGAVSATTYYGDGSNLTGINATEVTGFTFDTGNYQLELEQSNDNNFMVDLSILASDMTITGGTYNSSTGTATFTNNSGGTFDVTGFLTGFTDIYTTGATYDVSTGEATFTRNDGNSYSVSGFYTGGTDTYVTGFTNNNNVFTISDNTGQDFSTTLESLTGLTIGGNLDVISIDPVDYIQFYTAATQTNEVGRLRWNNTDGTLDLGLKGGNVTLQIGQETVIRVVNKTGSNLLESQYKVVRIRTQAEGGAAGQRLAVKLAQANTKANHSGILGVVTEDINNNQEGFITSFGNINKINTTGSLQGETWLDGDDLWLSDTVAGGLTNIEPTTHPVRIGYVLYAHSVNGKIFISLENGVDELNELHDVKISGATGGDSLQYDATTSLWKNSHPYWTVDLMDNSSVEFYAVQDVKINSITNIVGAPSITIADDGVPYTLTNTILSGSKITVTSNIQSVVKLNITY